MTSSYAPSKSIPTSPQRTESNAQRIINASSAITLAGYSFDTEGVTDLLTDLLHWCDEHQADFTQCLRTASHHHLQESHVP